MGGAGPCCTVGVPSHPGPLLLSELDVVFAQVCAHSHSYRCYSTAATTLSHAPSLGLKAARINAVAAMSPMIHAYDFADNHNSCTITLQLPCNMGRLLLVSEVERVASKIIIRSTENVQKCVVTKGEKDSKDRDLFVVQGINLMEMWKHADLLNINKLKSNDIWAMNCAYGVEAARATMLREINAVFNVYGITVDHRHISLITDFMCLEGSIRPLNRIGMRTSVAPFHKMSFETSLDFLRQATLEGDHDTCLSNSSRLVVGKLAPGGTGCAAMLQPL